MIESLSHRAKLNLSRKVGGQRDEQAKCSDSPVIKQNLSIFIVVFKVKLREYSGPLTGVQFAERR
jgi:hypothetical protein